MQELLWYDIIHMKAQLLMSLRSLKMWHGSLLLNIGIDLLQLLIEFCCIWKEARQNC